jgi:L-iditol 2-dehydrogenase
LSVAQQILESSAPPRERRSRQAVLVAPRRIEVREIVMPHPRPGEILLKVECALSCGTDLKAFRRGHPLWPMPAPFGHEFAGIVAETGDGVTNFRVGDAVMAAPTAPCGNCFYCTRDQENLCPEAIARMVLGGYADYLLIGADVVARNAFLKPADLPFAEAALLEPLSCVLHAHAMARPEPFEAVLIIGPGAFGLLHAIVLKALGVREVSVAGRSPDRLEWAGQLGADRVFDVRHGDIEAAIASLNHGFGPDLVIE